MRQVTTVQLEDLLAELEPPCVSLYQSTHRHHPENQQDPIRYRNLLRKLESTFSDQDRAQDVPALLEKFKSLDGDHRFWNHRTDGLAVLGSAGCFEVFELQRSVPELLIVGERFHTRPLLQTLQSADRYQILSLNRHEAKLYEGNRYALDPVELSDVPSTITEALGGELTEPHQTVAAYGKGSKAPRAPHGEPRMYHGHGARKDENEIDEGRFFRIIDRAILEHHSRPSGLPLMLAAMAEYQAPFRKISHNPYLMEQGIELNPEALTHAELCAEAWRVIEPFYQQRLAKLVDDFQTARHRQLGSDDLGQVAAAAAAGRVGTLLVEAERETPGKVDTATGQIESGDSSHPEIGDVLDDLANMVLQRRGDVIVVPTERMPSKTGVAAIFSF